MSRRPSFQAVTRTRLLVAGVVAIALAGIILAVTNAFGGSAPAANAGTGASTSTTTIERRDLSSQTQQSATLGYADATTIAIPPGTAPTAVQQAQQQSESASQSLQSAQATLAADQLALTQARAALSAGQRKLAADCTGDSAAGMTTTPCAADAQAVATEQQAVTSAKAKVDADQHAVESARASVTAASQSLASAQSSASTYGQTSVYTMLPPVGRIVHRGEPLYAIDGQATLLLYGTTPASRAFESGMTAGPDVAELNANLTALGYGNLAGDAFTSGTQSAIEALQAKHGLAVTGKLLFGSVVFEPSAVRVTSVTPTVGGAIQAGSVLGITSTRRIVTIALDASSQTSVKVGDSVVITLPDNSTTPGHVSYVGTVATTPSSDNGGSSTPTIEVDVTPDNPKATGRLDQAPVNVSITTETVRNVLVVPVNALLALAGGGYALEVVGAGGVHSLEAVQLGLFDDADGLVQVSGPSVRVGQRVVVPASS
ncbi:MAG TPA: peptidoglycan-binding protein [Gaiellaceae bacterium]|nr:peptidoglycan-binding protein [Gaiellaceae bacterium]